MQMVISKQYCIRAGKVIKIVSVFDQDGEELSNIDPKEFFEDNSFDH